jgi:hypothetical protein
VDTLIRRHCYRGREAALRAMAAEPQLAANLAAVAHLIHGSTEGRFTVTHALSPELSRAELEGVGFGYLRSMRRSSGSRATPSDIPNPGLGLWRT